MVPELLLLVVLLAAAAGCSYVLKEHRRSKFAEAEESQRLEKQAQEEAVRLEESFRGEVIRELRETKLSKFRLSEFARQNEMPTEIAIRTGESLYSVLCRKATEDAVITEDERRNLA